MTVAPHVPASVSDALADRYTFERELGAGGMATVYLAHDRKHDRPVAIKVLREATAAALGAERFDREIKVLARLRHPFILPLYDSGVAAGALFFVMPCIDGESLRARLGREGQLPVGDAVEIVRQLADALQYAHDEGVVHRDVKPENILLSRHGHALLADFGIARGANSATRTFATLTEVGLAIGTTAYMSPEQALGDAAIDGRSDIYSLGCVLYEMLAGVPPFHGPTVLSIVSQHLTTPSPDLRDARPELPPSIARAVSRALEKEPGARFASAAEFAQAVVVTGEVAPPKVRSLTALRLSIAVLPVVNQSANPDDEFFSDGMTEELINALARVEGLRVVSRTSTFAFKGKELPVREIGARLDVGFVLEGSVRRAGKRLRVAARLINVSDDSTLWSETFERQLEDVFAVQDEITSRIVETITEALQLGHLRGVSPVKQPRSLAAYDLYLLGRHHWYKRSEVEMRRAVELFEQAIEADPNYAPAYAGLADSLALLASWQFAAPEEMYPRAVVAARRALELDPSSAEAHASIGFVNMNWEWNWEVAVSELRRAIELNPSFEVAHRWLSAFLAGIGRADEALPIARRAIELDPISVLPRMNLCIVYFLAGRHAAAETEIRRALEMDPKFVRATLFLASTLSWQERHEEAVAASLAALEASRQHPMFRAVHGITLARAGRTAEARAILDPIMSSGLEKIYKAMAHASLGETEAAIEALEFASEQHADWMYSVGRQPWFQSFRTHPRFVRLLEKMRLVEPMRSLI